MNSFFSILLMILLPIIIFSGIYAYIMIPIKMKMKMLSSYVNEYAEKLKSEGLDKYYDGLETQELINLYNELMINYESNKTDLMQIAETGCKVKFIEDILTKRNVNVPKS